MKWFTINITNCPLLTSRTSFLFDGNYTLISKFLKNYLRSTHFQTKRFVFQLHKSLNTIKISIVEMSFAKSNCFVLIYNQTYFIPRIRPSSRCRVPCFSGSWWRQKDWSNVARWIYDIIKLLLHEGADVNRKDIFNKTALHSAALCNNLEAAQLLLNAGADINIKTNNNKTPLDEAPKGTEVELLLQQLQQSAP